MKRLLCLFRHSWQEETRYFSREFTYRYMMHEIQHRQCLRCGKAQWFVPYFEDWAEGYFRSEFLKEKVRGSEPDTKAVD